MQPIPLSEISEGSWRLAANRKWAPRKLATVSLVLSGATELDRQEMKSRPSIAKPTSSRRVYLCLLVNTPLFLVYLQHADMGLSMQSCSPLVRQHQHVVVHECFALNMGLDHSLHACKCYYAPGRSTKLKGHETASPLQNGL